MLILGISCFYHDSAAVLLRDGEILWALQEERFTRKKHDSRFPKNAIQFILNREGLCLNDLEAVVFYEKPSLKFDRMVKTFMAYVPQGVGTFVQAMSKHLRQGNYRTFLLGWLQEIEPSFHDEDKILFSEHHLSHAASAFYPSPFDNSAILTMDGVGEWATTSYGIGDGAAIDIQKEVHFPHSLGLLYSAFTSYTGFKVNSGEYKVMGLAPYGEPVYADKIRENLMDIRSDGSFALNMEYFDYCVGNAMTTKAFHELFEGPPRKEESDVRQKDMDLAASVQVVVEDVILKMARHIASSTGYKNLCLAGGVALNCVANGKLIREEIFDRVWIQPASGDAGNALGAALAAYHLHFQKKRVVCHVDSMKGSYLGSSFSEGAIESSLETLGARFELKDYGELTKILAQELNDGKAVGLFQGRMEFGPRALGGRSIIADPRNPEMQKQLNLKVKFREGFRPFAPAVMKEHAEEWFGITQDSPYMLIVSQVLDKHLIPIKPDEQNLFGLDKLNCSRSTIPAVTHVDYSARVQTVSKQTNSYFHGLLEAFYDLTGCPVLINTSFNVRGEPIVCSVEDAFRCFMETNLDILVVENFVLYKDQQDSSLKTGYVSELEKD